MTLIVDHREAWFEGGDEIEVRALPLGDFAIEIGGRVAVLIERKTLADLWASIRDTRHADQLRRLRCARDQGVRVMYIIEGDIDAWRDGAEKKSLRTACANLMLRDAIPVVFTACQRATRDAVFDLASRATSHPEWFVQDPAFIGPTNAANASALRKPRDAAGVLRAMLCVMPHVSGHTADQIMAECGENCTTVSGLEIAIRGGVLDRVRVGGRRISRVARETIERHFGHDCPSLDTNDTI